MSSQRELSLFDIVHLAQVPATANEAALRAQLGELAFSLWQLHIHNVQTVDGLVLTSGGFIQHCQRSGIPQICASDVSHQALAQQYQSAITAQLPDTLDDYAGAWAAAGFEASLLIVRPSFGQPLPVAAQELLTPQIGTLDELPEMLRAIWSEVFCARNLCYWDAHCDRLDQIPLALIIQPLPTIEQSGRSWVSAEQVVIERFWGGQWLGHPQEIDVDLTVLDRQTGEPRFVQRNPQQLIHTILGNWPQTLPMLDPLLVPGNQWLIPHALPQQQTASHPKLPPSPVSDSALMAQVDSLWPLFDQQPLRIDWQYADDHRLVVQAVYPGEGSPLARATMLMSHSEVSQGTDNNRCVATGFMAGQGEVIGRAMVVNANQALLRELSPHSILVTSHLTPEWLPLLRKVAGIITEAGGITSHAAVIARSLGIPAVVGVTGITQKVQSGNWLQIRGGGIYRLTATDAMTQLEAQAVAADNLPVAPTGIPAEFPVKLLVMLSNLDQLADMADVEVQGVGLFRGEHALAPRLDDINPWSDLQPAASQLLETYLFDQLYQLSRQIGEKPFWYRIADWRTHELQAESHYPQEVNPALGQHGVWRYQQWPEWLDMELRAIARLTLEERAHMRLILPFVRTAAEVKFCRSRLQKFGLDELPLWVMVEVPSMIYVLPELAELDIRGISIGLNDLIQLMFGVDRDAAVMQEFFDPNQPAVKPVLRSALQQLIETAQQLGFQCTVCSVPPDASLIQFLAKCGVNGLVMSPNDVGMAQAALFAVSSEAG